MRLHALLIDDEPDVAMALSFLLEPDWQVHICTDPKDAVRLVKQEKFDIIITDLLMPHASGHEVLAAAQTRANPPPVVISTGLSITDLQVQALVSKGAAAVIQKPFLQFDKIKEQLTTLAKKYAQANT